MKKSELRRIVREEIGKILHEGGPMDALGSGYGSLVNCSLIPSI